MKNKSLALAAAILLSAGIAFAFTNAGKNCCNQSMQAGKTAAATEACCDMPCPIEDCPLSCCGK